MELQYFQYTSDSGAVESVFIMDAIAPRWKQLGIALGFSGPQLDSIEKSKQYNGQIFGLFWRNGQTG